VAGQSGGEGAPADRKPVIALLASNAVSSIGNAASSIALAWFVLQTTGSATLMGVAAAAISIGGVLSSVLGGPLVDRMGLKRASVVADIVSSAAVAAIPLLELAGVLEFWHVIVLALLMSSVNTQGDTARYALMPPLASRAAMTMERANSADRAIARLGQITGPLIAGVLIALIGPVNVLFVNAATYLVSAALIAASVPRSPDTQTGAGRDAGGYVAELLEGLRFVRGNRLVLSLVLIATLANFLDVPLFSVIMPVYAQTFYGSATSLGIVLAAIAGGALVGTVIFAAVGRSWPRRLTFLSCLVVAPLLFYGMLVTAPPLAVLVAAAAIAGAITGPVNPLLLTVVQSNTPPHLAGRVFGALSAFAGVGIPIGSVVAGVAVERAGVLPTIAAMGVVYVAAVLAMFANPALRGMDRGASSQTEESLA
jgi:MFS family permease